MHDLVLRNVVIGGDQPVNVGIVDQTITTVSTRTVDGSHTVDGDGNRLIPGLHDHHIHLVAVAAAAASVDVGPGNATDLADLGRRVTGHRSAATNSAGWVRAVGYHHSVAGDLDRWMLDAVTGGHPVRVQDRTGARWTLNSAAIDRLGLEQQHLAGLERDQDGMLTGRVHRGDALLHHLLRQQFDGPHDPPPDLAEVGRQLLDWGITGVTDTTPYRTLDELDTLSVAAASGGLPQRVVVTGSHHLAGSEPPHGLTWGPVKVVIDDIEMPSLDDLVEQIRAAHGAGRPVAVHAVTLPALVLALAAWDDAGARPGDRLEHGAVVPPHQAVRLAGTPITVVTQPAFVAERGDQYLADVDPRDVAHLYPLRSLLDAGVPLAGGSDAPYTSATPWAAIRAATDRSTRGGKVVGPSERLDCERALALYLGPAADPGGQQRRVAPGQPADLCLIERNWATAEHPVYGVVLAGRWIAGGRTR